MRLVLLLQYPLLNHLGAFLELPELRLVAILLVGLGVFIPGLINLQVRSILSITGVWALCVGLYVIGQVDWLYLLLPALVPLFLLLGFGMSLRHGEEPLITKIGERARGPLSTEMRTYTRRLTIVWTVLFGLFLVQGSILVVLRLMGFAQVYTESWILNVFTPVLVVLVFVVEFYLRRRRFPEHDHPTFWEYVQIVRQGG